MRSPNQARATLNLSTLGYTNLKEASVQAEEHLCLIEPKLCSTKIDFFEQKFQFYQYEHPAQLNLGFVPSRRKHHRTATGVNQDAIRYLAHCAKFSSKSVTKFLTFSTNLALAVDVGVTTFASTDSNVFHFFSLTMVRY